jgi:hypothetical protein
MLRCRDLGIETSVMGLHVGSYEAETYDVCYDTANGSARKFLTVESRAEAARTIRRIEKRDEAYLKLLPKAVYNRLLSDDPNVNNISFTVRRTIIQPSQNELDHITNSCQIIFATYQIFSKGVDVPRLDMGVEALPSGNVLQPVGRILRLSPDKPTPEWYAIDDRVSKDGFNDESKMRWVNIINSYCAGKTETRIRALERAGARISYQ